MKKLYHFVLIIFLFFSCTDGQEDPTIVRSTTSNGTDTNSDSSENTTSTTDNTQTTTPTTDNTQTTTPTDNSSSTSTGNIFSDEIDYSIYEVQFINENIGYATAGDKLLKTNDSGNSWSIIYSDDSSRASISEVLFVSENVGFMNNNDELYKTTNGGNTFDLKYENSNPNLINPRPIVDIYLSNETLIISRGANNRSKIVSYNDDDCEDSTGIVVDSMIVISQDNGESFESYDFRDSNSANNTIDGIIDSHGHFSIIVKDNILFMDMGRSSSNWVVRFDLETNDLENFVYNENRQLFLDSDMIVQTPSIRIKTYSIVGDKIYAFGHYFEPNYNSNEDNGFIYSTNNGESWTYKSFGKYEEITFYSSYFSSSNIGYIVGESGHFLKTTDGGDNWTKIDLGTFKNIHDIERVNDTTLILVGEDGFIYKYDTTN